MLLRAAGSCRTSDCREQVACVHCCLTCRAEVPLQRAYMFDGPNKVDTHYMLRQQAVCRSKGYRWVSSCRLPDRR